MGSEMCIRDRTFTPECDDTGQNICQITTISKPSQLVERNQVKFVSDGSKTTSRHRPSRPGAYSSRFPTMANGGSRRGLYGEGRRTAVAAETHSPPHVHRARTTRVGGKKTLIRSLYCACWSKGDCCCFWCCCFLLEAHKKSFGVKISKIRYFTHRPPPPPEHHELIT